MSEELWYVKLANGDVHRVTLDQLDGAFQAGHIDESTMVLAAGGSTWTKLGDLAGLDDEGQDQGEGEGGEGEGEGGEGEGEGAGASEAQAYTEGEAHAQAQDPS